MITIDDALDLIKTSQKSDKDIARVFRVFKLLKDVDCTDVRLIEVAESFAEFALNNKIDNVSVGRALNIFNMLKTAWGIKGAKQNQNWIQIVNKLMIPRHIFTLMKTKAIERRVQRVSNPIKVISDPTYIIGSIKSAITIDSIPEFTSIEHMFDLCNNMSGIQALNICIMLATGFRYKEVHYTKILPVEGDECSFSYISNVKTWKNKVNHYSVINDDKNDIPDKIFTCPIAFGKKFKWLDSSLNKIREMHQLTKTRRFESHFVRDNKFVNKIIKHVISSTSVSTQTISTHLLRKIYARWACTYLHKNQTRGTEIVSYMKLLGHFDMGSAGSYMGVEFVQF